MGWSVDTSIPKSSVVKLAITSAISLFISSMMTLGIAIEKAYPAQNDQEDHNFFEGFHLREIRGL
jgi:hypothetical protein